MKYLYLVLAVTLYTEAIWVLEWAFRKPVRK